MKIFIDALNIKRGGGVTVLFRLLKGFASYEISVRVLLSSPEVYELLKKEQFNSTVESELKAELQSQVRAYTYRAFRLKKDIKLYGASSLFCFNFMSPCSFPQTVFHLNVIPFLDFKQRVHAVGLFRSIAFKLFSQAAITRAKLNIFESKHLLELAESTQQDIKNPAVRYIGIDEPNQPLVSGSLSVKRQIVTITSGSAHKRNDLTIELHRRLNSGKTVGDQVELVIGGFGKEREIRASLSKADNEYIDSVKSIRFLGYCTRDELFEELSVSSLFVTFSELESFYMVALEAMIVGCPVVAPCISSIEESVGAAGFLFEVGNMEQAEGLVRTLMQAENRAKASQKSLEWSRQFREEECVEQLISLVHQTYS